jgi:hypothetical protein
MSAAAVMSQGVVDGGRRQSDVGQRRGEAPLPLPTRPPQSTYAFLHSQPCSTRYLPRP